MRKIEKENELEESKDSYKLKYISANTCIKQTGQFEKLRKVPRSKDKSWHVAPRRYDGHEKGISEDIADALEKKGHIEKVCRENRDVHEKTF